MGKRRFAVFDIDGTVFRFALFHSVVDELAIQGTLDAEHVAAIESGRKTWRERKHPEAFWDFVEPSVAAFEHSLKGMSVTEHLRAVDKVFTEQKDHVYTYTRDLIKKLKSDGYYVIAISGSQMEAVEKFSLYYGFDDWIGTVYGQKNGVYTGEVDYAHKDKHLIVKKMIEKHDLSHAGSIAVGDTHRDISMLETCETPIAFNPNKQLLEHARKHGWKVVVERKNVIYELEPRDGHFVLA